MYASSLGEWNVGEVVGLVIPIIGVVFSIVGLLEKSE